MWRMCLAACVVGCGLLAGCSEGPSSQDVSTWDQGRTVLVFTTPDCYACKRDYLEVERLRSEVASDVRVIEVNGRRHPELAARFGVRQYPTYVVCEDGEVKGFTTNVKILFKIVKVLFFLAMFFM